MKFDTFYHETIKKYVVIFGTLFNDIYVDRVDTANVAQQSIKVPISYGPKERYIARTEQNPELTREISLVYPRMSFEIKNMNYDSSRKMTKNQQLVNGNSYAGTLTTAYREVPYNFDFSLSIIARNQSDILRIVEQILPFYTPDWTVSVNLIPELNITRDIPIIIKNVDPADLYEGKFEDKEYAIWDLGFTLKGYLYGPTDRSTIIKFSDANIWVDDDTNGFIQGADFGKLEVTPGLTSTGKPASNASLSVAVSSILANSNFGFITTANNSAK